VHTSGPRRYSRLELCTTRQLESLSTEFCYDVETLTNIADALGKRTCRHSAHIKKSVDRQLKALRATPPSYDHVVRTRITWWAASAVACAVVLAVAVDQISHWLLST
jgi:hypothetical protein